MVRLTTVSVLALVFLSLPLYCDFVGISLIPGVSQLDPDTLEQTPRVHPLDILSLFEFVNLILLVCYLSTTQSNFWRLLIGLGILAAAGLGFLSQGISYALANSPAHKELAQRAYILGAYANAIAVSLGVGSNLVARNMQKSYFLATTLLLGGALGMIFAPIWALSDPRSYTFAMGEWSSRRFSISEICYLVSLAWTAYLFFGDKITLIIADRFAPRLQRVYNQGKLIDHYHQYMRWGGGVEVVDRAWERRLRLSGSRLPIRRQGRSYYGVPTINEAYAEERYVQTKQQRWLLAAKIFAAVICLVGLGWVVV